MTMVMGEGAHAPPWAVEDGDEAAASAYNLLAELRHYLPPCGDDGDGEDEDEDAAAAVDAYACDEFRMYEFKVRRCARGRSHDWTDCPFAHPGEKARRRDPRRHHYSGAACPDFRRGACRRGDACDLAHGVFECWLHPARYRTQPCKDGTACRRRVCFFAHTPDQLRVVPGAAPPQHSPRGGAVVDSYDGSPLRRHAFESYLTKAVMMSSSPTSTLASPSDSSPPLSPDALRRGSWAGDVMASPLRLGGSPSGGSPLASSYQSGAFGSPKSTGVYTGTMASSPVTVTAPSGATVTVERLNLGLVGEAEEAPMERVESGRALREKVFERLSKEATAVPSDAAAAAGEEVAPAPATAPDVGWVSDLIN
ncbi:hypothetical protein ACP4OV_027941 [Aristida adscensionis]